MPSNLEPIEESDVDLAHKFKVGNENPQGFKSDSSAVEKEVPRETVAAEKDVSYDKILSKVQSHPVAVSSDDDVKKDAQSAFEKMDIEGKIQHLVDLALLKGVLHSVNVARHMEDNYVLDMLHDKLLADELHDALLKKGLIKSE